MNNNPTVHTICTCCLELCPVHEVDGKVCKLCHDEAVAYNDAAREQFFRDFERGDMDADFDALEEEQRAREAPDCGECAELLALDSLWV